MLGKLLKYENKTLAKTLFPLGIGVLLVALLGAFMMKLNLFLEGRASEFVSSLVGITTAILLIFSFLAIISAAFIAVFLILQRYYKSFFTDEGYLTFTLPVKTHELLFTKLISSILWSLFIALCVVAGIVLFGLFGTSVGWINDEVSDFFRLLFEEIGRFFGEFKGVAVLQTVEGIFLGIGTLCMQFLMYELAITLGSIIAKKHKILASIGMYFGVNFACQTINSILVLFAFPVLLFEGNDAINLEVPQTLTLFLLFPLILYAVYSVVFFLINRHLLKNKLNLD